MQRQSGLGKVGYLARLKFASSSVQHVAHAMQYSSGTAGSATSTRAICSYVDDGCIFPICVLYALQRSVIVMCLVLSTTEVLSAPQVSQYDVRHSLSKLPWGPDGE